MKRMQEVIASGGTAFDNFMPLLAKFMTPLSVQLSDLRSAIVKEAYNTLLQAVEACRDSFEGCADRLSDTLFKILNSGTKVLADAAHQSFMAILENVVTWKLVGKTVENIRSKNAYVRGKSAGYLAYMLEHYPKQVFEAGEAARGRVFDQIEQGILSAIHDASPEARSAGRSGYVCYRSLFPERSDAVYYRLDPAAQKAVAEMIGGTPSRHSKTQPLPSSAAPSTAGSKRNPAARESPQPTRPAEEPPKRPSSMRTSPAAPSKTTSSRPTTSTTPVKELTVSEKWPESKPPTVEKWPESKPAAVEKWPESKPAAVEKWAESKPMASTTTATPVSEAPQRPPSRPYFSSRARPPVPPVESPPAVESAKFDSTGDTGSSASAIVLKLGEQPREPPTQAPPPMLEEEQEVVEPPQAPKMKSKSKEIGPGEKLDFIIEKTYHENWSTRCNSFTRLVSTISAEEDLESLLGSADIKNPLWDKLVNTHIEHMSDSHFKVVAACLSSLQKLIELLPEKVSYELEKLMPTLLICLGDAKESVYQSSCTVLELIIDLYMADDLLKLVLKNATGDVKPKMKVKLLDVLGILGETSEGYFNVAVNVKAFVRKVVALCRDGLMVKQVLQAGCRAITSVRDKNPEVTLTLISELSAEEQSILRRLSNEVPKALEEELKIESTEAVQKPVKIVKQPENPVYEYFTNVLELCKGAGLAKVDGLSKLQKLIDEYATHPGVWGALGKDIVAVLCSYFGDESVSVKEAALGLVLKAYGSQHDKLRPQLEAIVNALVKALYVEDRHSMQITEDTAQALLEIERKEVWCELLLSHIAGEDSPALQALLRVLTRIMKRIDKLACHTLLTSVMATLAKALNHSNPDVRKTVVFSLVELNHYFGEAFQPYIGQLSQSQQKLVTIYIQRRQEPYI